MPVPHFNIKITQRSKGNSAVAGAAYQAGEKLFSEYDQKTKNYTCKKEHHLRCSGAIPYGYKRINGDKRNLFPPFVRHDLLCGLWFTNGIHQPRSKAKRKTL